ncbi:MAG: Wzz/FepE/Etk N-terminal domain-containing protein [Chloroflexi bacterium]|nr:Wzz/FepE/Etk N-terminal domain-containing protein [Chloroflexota bacterium]
MKGEAMELGRLLAVLQRRLGLIAVITLLTAVVSAGYTVLRPGPYTVRTELLINPLAVTNASADKYYYPPYYQEQAAQFILDDFAEVIRGTTFAKAVIAQLQKSPDASVRTKASRMTSTDAASALSKQFKVSRVNRVLEIDVADTNRSFALAAAAAADQLILKEGPTFFANLDPSVSSHTATMSSVTVSVSDEPHVTVRPSLIKTVFFWLLRTLVGVTAAIVLALALHYLDTRLYDGADVRDLLGLPALGEVHVRPLGAALDATSGTGRADAPGTAARPVQSAR